MNTRKISSVPGLTVLAIVGLMTLAPLSSRAQDPAYGAPQYNNGQYPDADQQADPPSRVGRLSVIQGNVSFQPASVQDFSAAELNYPLTTGDRLYTDNGARAEVEAGQIALRMGSATDLTLTTITDQFVQFGLAQGSIHLRTYALDQNNGAEVDTSNASINIQQRGDVRIDAYPQDNITIVSVFAGQAQVNAEDVQETLQAGQSIRISSLSADRTRRPRYDDLDSFSGQRDVFYQRAYATEGSYINADTIGAADLSAYGDWDSSPDYGAVWYPRSVAADWAPYSTGRWVSIAPWGWTWVGSEPWGFAPFHYGRWNRFGNRWGWIPGPPVVHPVYSPALVVFVGGPRYSVGGGSFSLSIGGGGGGVAAWFPLGPREVYRPWYRASPIYTNRINVTNIYNQNTVQIRTIYNDRRDAYADRGQTNYINRSVATVAVTQRSFGSGRPVRESALRVDPRQLQNAPIMERPPVQPAAHVEGPRPVLTALPPRIQRPVLETHGAPNPADPHRGDFSGRNGAAPANSGAPYAGRPTPGQPNGYQPGNNQPNRGNRTYPAPQGQPSSERGNANGGRNNSRTPAQPTPATQPVQLPLPANNGYPGRNNGRGNNGTPAVQPTPSTQPVQPPAATPVAPSNNGYGGRNNDPRFNNGRNPGQPAAAPQPPATAPAQPAQPTRNGYDRGNDGRFNRSADAVQPAPYRPAPAAQPVAPPPVVPSNNGYGGRNNDPRFNNGRSPGQPATAPQPPATVPAQPARNGYDRGNDGRFNRPADAAQPAPSRPAPYAQPVPSAPVEAARPGPRRQAPDVPVRVDPPYNQPRPQPAAPVQPRPAEQARPQPAAPVQPRSAEQRRPEPAPAQPAPQQQRQAPQARPAAPPVHAQPPQPVKPEDKK